MVKLADDAHRLREVHVAHPQAVNAVHVRDLVEVFQCLRALDLADQQVLAVRLGHVRERVRPHEVVMRSP